MVDTNTDQALPGGKDRGTPPKTPAGTNVVPAGPVSAEPRLGTASLNERLAGLLEAGDVEAFNAQRPPGRIELKGINLSGKKLDGVNLDDADLSDSVLDNCALNKATFRGAILRDTSMVGVIAKEADFGSAQFLGTDCREAVLTEARLDGATCKTALFNRAQLQGAKARDAKFIGSTEFIGAQLNDANFSESAFNHVDFTEMVAPGANFKGSKIDYSDFNGALLTESNFMGSSLLRCDVQRTNFGKSNFEGATLRKVDGLKTDFTGSRLKSARIESSELPGVSFKEANLSDIKAHRCSFDGGDFTRALAERADFSHSSLQQGAKLDGGWFEEATFYYAKIQGSAKKAYFKSAKFEHGTIFQSDFTEACISEGRFVQSTLDGVNGTRMDASGARFDQAQLQLVKFGEADIERITFELSFGRNCEFKGAFAGKAGCNFPSAVFMQGDRQVRLDDVTRESATPERIKYEKPKGDEDLVERDAKGRPKVIALTSAIKPEFKADYDAAWAEINNMVGLESPKQTLHDIGAAMEIRTAKAEFGRKPSDFNEHFVFAGPPGAGKTTFARPTGRILKGNGYLTKGHVVECDRSTLVAGYVGQTESNTLEIIEKAKGGVLFIDEAYSLTSGGKEDFGHRALEIILKAMEDCANGPERFVVIIAGYRNRIKEFVNSNPGLQRRFTSYFKFKSYTPNQLAEIGSVILKKQDLGMMGVDNAVPSVLGYLMKERADENFGNAGEIRNAIGTAIKSQARRLKKQGSVTEEDTTTLKAEDFPWQAQTGVPFDKIPWSELRWELKGADGKVVREVTADELGRTVIDPITKLDVKVGYPDPTAKTVEILKGLSATYKWVPPQEDEEGEEAIKEG